jgi:hypothetical protein
MSSRVTNSRRFEGKKAALIFKGQRVIEECQAHGEVITLLLTVTKGNNGVLSIRALDFQIAQELSVRS